jgi:hypothetical protein
MAPSEKSLEAADRVLPALKAQSVITHHPKIMGDTRNGRFKYLFEFAVKSSHLP